jgi:hypothetical protein
VKQLADGVWHLDTFFLPNSINAYLVGDVLIGHGAPLRDTKKFVDFLEALPD